MSTVLHAHRLADGRLEEILERLRLTYEREHPVATEIGAMAIAARRQADRAWAWGRVRELLAEGANGQADWLPVLQLFREEGPTWLCRPLEIGHFFDQAIELAGLRDDLEPVGYDDRTDVPAADEPNRAVASWVDRRIRRGAYLLHPLLDRTRLELWAGRIARGEQG